VTELSNIGRNASVNTCGYQSDDTASDGGEIVSIDEGSSTTLELFRRTRIGPVLPVWLAL
jgi:hypothetical protein